MLIKLLAWDKVKSASAANVWRFFSGEYWVKSLTRDGDPSKEVKSCICCIGCRSNKLWYGLNACKHLKILYCIDFLFWKYIWKLYLSMSSGSIIFPFICHWWTFCGRQKLNGIHLFMTKFTKPTNILYLNIPKICFVFYHTCSA